MKKKYLTLGIFLPYYVLAQNLTILEEIPVITQGEKRSNSLNIDLQKEEQHQSNSFLDLFKKESSMEVENWYTFAIIFVEKFENAAQRPFITS